MRRSLAAIAIGLVCAAGFVRADTGDQPPHMDGQDDPHFPLKMHFGEDQAATFLFKVGVDGRASQVKMMASTRPDMEEPFVDALLHEWVFSPGMRNGFPAAMFTEQTFGLNVYKSIAGVMGSYRSGPWAWGVPAHAAPGAPAEFQYDQAPQPVLTLPAAYPRDLLVQGIKGSATIAFTIDPGGKPRQFAVVDASNPEFGLATIAMLSSWQFSSPGQAGRACWAAIRMTQKFDLNDEDIAGDDDTERIVRALNRNPSPIVPNLKELDAPVRLLYGPAPVVPEDLVRSGETARAVIEIVVDRHGHAQAPRIVSATRDDFGWAAATAAGRWQFSIPAKGGDAVDVMAQVPFEYRPPQRPSSGDVSGPKNRIFEIRVEHISRRWQPFQWYVYDMVKTANKEWGHVASYLAPSNLRGSVRVEYILDSDGAISLIKSVECSPGTSQEAKQACLSGLTNRAPYPAWSDEMIEALGNQQRIILDFEY